MDINKAQRPAVAAASKDGVLLFIMAESNVWTFPLILRRAATRIIMPKVRWRAESYGRRISVCVVQGVALRLILVAQEVLIQLHGMSQLCR